MERYLVINFFPFTSLTPFCTTYKYGLKTTIEECEFTNIMKYLKDLRTLKEKVDEFNNKRGMTP